MVPVSPTSTIANARFTYVINDPSNPERRYYSPHFINEELETQG